MSPIKTASASILFVSLAVAPAFAQSPTAPGVPTTPSATATTMSDADCQAAWKAADANNDGFVTEAEGARYHAAYRVRNIELKDGRIAQSSFMEQCRTGLFTRAVADKGAPLEGANSFTEQQAKDRAVSYGFSNVSALKKDDKGIWRGTASEGSKSVNIAIDFKGNVVAQ